MDITLIINFLSSRLLKSFIASAFIFGSLAKGKKNANDCDLFIVTILTPDDTNWNMFINENAKLKTDFLNLFSMKLNFTINTFNEFNEGSEFKQRILNRPIIIII